MAEKGHIEGGETTVFTQMNDGLAVLTGQSNPDIDKTLRNYGKPQNPEQFLFIIANSLTNHTRKTNDGGITSLAVLAQETAALGQHILTTTPELTSAQKIELETLSLGLGYLVLQNEVEKLSGNAKSKAIEALASANRTFVTTYVETVQFDFDGTTGVKLAKPLEYVDFVGNTFEKLSALMNECQGEKATIDMLRSLMKIIPNMERGLRAEAITKITLSAMFTQVNRIFILVDAARASLEATTPEGALPTSASELDPFPTPPTKLIKAVSRVTELDYEEVRKQLTLPPPLQKFYKALREMGCNGITVTDATPFEDAKSLGDLIIELKRDKLPPIQTFVDIKTYGYEGASKYKEHLLVDLLVPDNGRLLSVAGNNYGPNEYILAEDTSPIDALKPPSDMACYIHLKYNLPMLVIRVSKDITEARGKVIPFRVQHPVTGLDTLRSIADSGLNWDLDAELRKIEMGDIGAVAYFIQELLRVRVNFGNNKGAKIGDNSEASSSS